MKLNPYVRYIPKTELYLLKKIELAKRKSLKELKSMKKDWEKEFDLFQIQFRRHYK